MTTITTAHVAAVAEAIGCPEWTGSKCDCGPCYCKTAAENVLAVLKPLDQIQRIDNPRHQGFVRRFLDDDRVRVVWNNGWIEDLEVIEIERTL